MSGPATNAQQDKNEKHKTKSQHFINSHLCQHAIRVRPVGVATGVVHCDCGDLDTVGDFNGVGRLGVLEA